MKASGRRQLSRGPSPVLGRRTAQLGFLSSLAFAKVDFPLRSQSRCRASGPSELLLSLSLPKLQNLRTGLSAQGIPDPSSLPAITLLEAEDILWAII